MSISGWQQATVWLLGSRLPLGEPHDGFGRRPQVRAAAGPQGQPGLLICDELANTYFCSIQGSRLDHRQWLEVVAGDDAQARPLAHDGAPIGGDYRYSLLRPSVGGFDGVTLEGTALGGSPLHTAPIAPPDLIQSCFSQGQTLLHPPSQRAGVLRFQASPRLLLNRRGVPETIHWRRDRTCDLLLATEDGQVLRWEGLDDPANDAPLTDRCPGKPVLAAGVPMHFEGLPHLCVVDWNLRGRSDLLVATVGGELWLFYDVGDDDQVAYDRGRCLCDANGPLRLFGGGSATILHLGRDRWLVAADGQGQLWHWPLIATTSWVVSDWREAGVVETGQGHVASQYETGRWWLQNDNRGRPLLRLGPPRIEAAASPDRPIAFPPLPPELTLPLPCEGLCEVHVTLASLAHAMAGDAPPLESMLDLRLDDQPQPRMVSAGDLHDGPYQEIHWDTVDLTGRQLCLRGLHGGFLYEGGLPVAVASIRIVPLSPGAASSDEEDAAAPAGFELENTHRPASLLRQEDDQDIELDRNEPDDDEELGEELLDNAAHEPVKLAAMLDSFTWTSMIRTDSAIEVDDLIARCQEAGIHRLYFKLGGAAWEFPTHVRGGRAAVPRSYSPQAEAWSRRQADHFEHINRLELAAAACRRRGMELFGWIQLQAHDRLDGGEMGGAVSQFYVDHAHYLEKDIHGRPVPGRLCLGYQEVRDHYIQVACEALGMGAQGILIDTPDHLPCAMYGDPLLAQCHERHGVEMRSLSPFDLRVAAIQGQVVSGFLRELRDAMHHAQPRLRAPLQIAVARLHTVMGCDPVSWAREHLVDAVILQHDGSQFRPRDLTPLSHALQDTYCQCAAGFARSRWGSPARPMPTRQFVREVARCVSQGAAFILLGQSTWLIRHRGLAQCVRRINHPGDPLPRAVLA